MDNDYFSINAILAEAQRVECKFELDVPNLGYLGGGDDVDLKNGTKLQIPIWLASTLQFNDWVEFTMPHQFAFKVRKALNADPRNVKLSVLVGETGLWYDFGKTMAAHCESPYDRELLDILMKTFQARLVELMDQAQHFAGTSSSAGAVSGGEGGEDFREGLEATERELFALAQDSAKQIKAWYESSDRR